MDWISHETLQLAADKRLAKQSRFESPANTRLYRDLCNQVHSAAKTGKNAWFQQKSIEINNNSPENRNSSFYRLIKDINHKWQPKQRFIKDSNDEVLQSDDEEVKKPWTDNCSQLYKKHPNPDMAVVIGLEAITPRQNDEDTKNCH